MSREDWQRKLGPLYGGAVALVQSTPWRWPTVVADEETRSSGWIVALGVPIGFVAWLAAAIVKGIGAPAAVAALVGLAMLSLASAALVERGLAERIDHWQVAPRGSTTTGREDERRSTTPAAILALVFVTLIRAASIVFIAPDSWLIMFIATAVIGRWAAVFLQALGDPIVGDQSKRSLVAAPAPLWLTAVISLAVAALVVLAIGKAGILVMAVAALTAFVLGIEAQRRDGGLSGPVVGVAAIVAEVVLLVIATSTSIAIKRA